jgi:hypothetical protein
VICIAYSHHITGIYNRLLPPATWYDEDEHDIVPQKEILASGDDGVHTAGDGRISMGRQSCSSEKMEDLLELPA